MIHDKQIKQVENKMLNFTWWILQYLVISSMTIANNPQENLISGL